MHHRNDERRAYRKPDEYWPQIPHHRRQIRRPEIESGHVDDERVVAGLAKRRGNNDQRARRFQPPVMFEVDRTGLRIDEDDTHRDHRALGNAVAAAPSQLVTLRLLPIDCNDEPELSFV
jgi:hypothetical protein